MLGYLAGIPGRLKTLVDRLTAGRAAALDNLDAAITSRAAASTAVSNVNYTSGRAALLDNLTYVAEQESTSAIINYCSAGGVLVDPTNAGAVDILPGAVTANVLKTVISETGRGRIDYLAIGNGLGSTKTIRLKITIDGNVVFDATSASNTGNIYGLIAVYAGCSVEYHSSLLVEGATSVSGTDTFKIKAIYSRRVAS
jgi:hypothetical protein